MRKIFKKAEKPKEVDQKPETKNEQQAIDEDVFRKLHIDLGFSDAFRGNEPLSWERYESLYCHGNGPGAYFSVPPYEEYLHLFKKYRGIITGEREDLSDYYFYNMR